MTIELKHKELKDDLREYLDDLKRKNGGELVIPESGADFPMVYRDNLELIQILLDSPEDSLEYTVAEFQLEENGVLPEKGPDHFLDEFRNGKLLD